MGESTPQSTAVFVPDVWTGSMFRPSFSSSITWKPQIVSMVRILGNLPERFSADVELVRRSPFISARFQHSRSFCSTVRA